MRLNKVAILVATILSLVAQNSLRHFLGPSESLQTPQKEGGKPCHTYHHSHKCLRNMKDTLSILI